MILQPYNLFYLLIKKKKKQPSDSLGDHGATPPLLEL